ncbi:D-alanyl-lipoteichoic acid biosynthesis protein DltD [Fructobacillus cardui]|uniref:D-alanyl-lipoteichoic acid biosynthesis protein DltD n=1 Tax=Fructobacillus cardui TaxID=2893170 RepID=UPI00200A0CCA|nr:D-alanyl-lipoteichoic acid biosynthesis protein DltD [Fructobacillus cardui]MCK8628072.1 D-alanyl-lipoteichoic acid biosynthesis protein DltD [Fructobacillus cardui]
MTNKKKLWQIFGPVLAALALIGLVFFLPFPLNHYSQQDLREASVSFSSQIVKGEAVKDAAFSDKKVNYIPFFGSSELSRFDSLHPSVLAEKYNRSYRPFMLGKAGSESMVHFLNMQEMPKALDHKKAVFVISPQWFTKTGSTDAFSIFYSPLQVVDWLLNMDKPSQTDQFMAQAVLKQSLVRDKPMFNRMLHNVEDGQGPSSADKSALRFQHKILSRQDALFSNFETSHNYKNEVMKYAKDLPNQYQEQTLNQIGFEQGEKNTGSNRFRIKNSFYRTRVWADQKMLKDAQVNYDYRKSVEYAYFQAVLENFAKNHTDVEFVITPVNQRWAAYTGLSDKMYYQAVDKIKYQLQSQGFNNIADLSHRGGEDFFMQDTIHIGWRGWLALDQYLNPFLSGKYQDNDYKINNNFLSKEWQNFKPQDQELQTFS